MSLFLLKSIKSVDKKYIGPVNFILPDVSYKYCSLSFISKKVDKSILSIIEQMPLKGGYKHILVDVKIHKLRTGQIPALPNWHFDCIKDPRDESKEETHHLFITGGSNTEFVKEDMYIEIPEIFNFSIFNNVIGEKIDPYTIYTYGRHLHRATKASIDCTRLLIRVSETDNMIIQNKEYKETYR